VDFFRKLFGGSSNTGNRGFGDDPDGLYYYVQPNGCDEVVRVRVHRYNDLSERDEGGYWAHKVVRGVKCTQGVELDLYYDAKRSLTHHTAENGVLVDAAAYQTWLDSTQANV
jgi:hypothetical protein